MDRVLVLIVTASELCAAASRLQHQYHVVHELKNITEAMSYCREKYTDLATIVNMEDVTILNKMADRSAMKSQYAWIGLYDDISSWRWSLADETLKFSNWDLHQPSGHGSQEHCGTTYDTGRWHDYNCESTLIALCMDVTGPKATFVLTGSPMTWTEAQSYCRANHKDLATVRNMPEVQRVKEMVPAGQAVWIGLFRDSWKWLDGRNSSFRYWNQEAGEPNNGLGNEACVVADFSQNGKWADWSCDGRNPFICYSFVFSKQVMKMRLRKKKSSLDLNNPAVMEDILKQLKQRLKDQGVIEEVRLSWRTQLDGKIFHRDEKKPKKKSKSPKADEL